MDDTPVSQGLGDSEKSAMELLEEQAPVNVKLRNPTEQVEDWDAVEWQALNAWAGGHPGFYPLTIKAAYVVGIIHDLCESVSWLLSHPKVLETTYIPAYGVFASGVELLGRCIRGNSTTLDNANDLKMGFKWLADSATERGSDDFILIETSRQKCSINMLTALRHFAAHGQATSNKTDEGAYGFGDLDYEILAKMPPLVADGLERYWTELRRSNDLCNKLANANIHSLRSWPVKKSWILFEKDDTGVYHSIVEIFNRFDWNIRVQS